MLARRAASSRSRCSVRVEATQLPSQFKAVKPVGDRVLVKVDREQARSVGGVLLPSSTQSKSNSGAVVSMGESTVVKMGDRVIYSKFAGTDLEIQDAAHVLLKEDDVIGTIGSDSKISKMTPLQDRVLIKCAVSETKSAGGVLLATENTEKPNFGTVVAVGPGKKKEDSDEIVKVNVSAGQTVMYSKYSGTEFEEDDVEYIVVRESDILAALA